MKYGRYTLKTLHMNEQNNKINVLKRANFPPLIFSAAKVSQITHFLNILAHIALIDIRKYTSLPILCLISQE